MHMMIEKFASAFQHLLAHLFFSIR